MIFLEKQYILRRCADHHGPTVLRLCWRSFVLVAWVSCSTANNSGKKGPCLSPGTSSTSSSSSSAAAAAAASAVDCFGPTIRSSQILFRGDLPRWTHAAALSSTSWMPRDAFTFRQIAWRWRWSVCFSVLLFHVPSLFILFDNLWNYGIHTRRY